MAFDVINTLETAEVNNGDIDWYDGGGTIQGDLVSHSGTTGGFWYVNNGSTPSGSTGPSSNPPGNNSFTYAEMSGSPSGYEYRGVWTTQYSNLSQALYVEIDYYLYCLAGSELFVEYSTAASPTPNTNDDWIVADSVVATGSDPGSWNTLQVDLSGIAPSATVSIRVRYLPVSNNYQNDGAIANWRIYSTVIDQDGFGFYDDGTESGSSAAAAEDTPITEAHDVIQQLRVQVDTTGDVPSTQFKLQFRKVGDADTEWEDLA